MPASVISRMALALGHHERIIAKVVKDTGVKRSELKSKTRKRRVAYARQEAYRRLWGEKIFSTIQIGNMFGRDHSTVIYGIRKAEERLNAVV